MQNSELPLKYTSKVIFVDYKPAELKINKEWIIVYYAKNPVTRKLERIRLRVPSIASRSVRLKHAKLIVSEINIKLSNGWSPFLEETGKNYKTLQACIEDFLSSIKKQIKDNVLRPDTLRTYNSNLNILQKFISDKKLNIVFALELNKRFCIDYLDWIYIERGSSPKTRNNHLGFIKLFGTFLVNKGVHSENPTAGILPMKLLTKNREVFPVQIKQKIYEKLLSYDNGYYALCMTTYFCFLRNAELGKLKAWMINFDNNSITLTEDVSKNKKEEVVTIPSQFLDILKKHVSTANNTDYVFSNNHYKPGSKKMTSNKIGNDWDILRKELKLPSKYKFYSFKDTGITDLLNSGVAAIKVRDQARHYDIEITEMYTPRSTSCDEVIQNANIQFGK